LKFEFYKFGVFYNFLVIFYFVKSLTSGKKEFSKKEDKMDYLSPTSCKETTGWLKSQSMQVKKGFPLLKEKRKSFLSFKGNLIVPV